jgi:hypothetical protein
MRTVNDALIDLAGQLGLDAPGRRRLRYEFGLACAVRVAHLLEEPAVADGLSLLAQHLKGSATHEELQHHAAEAARMANRHPGSRSIDGCGHAAVSATYAVANALAGKALAAAEYAAYATVYAEGGYGAVADPASFQPEFRWQVEALASLAASRQDAAPST